MVQTTEATADTAIALPQRVKKAKKVKESSSDNGSPAKDKSGSPDAVASNGKPESESIEELAEEEPWRKR
jgi:hypothetical protein